MLTVLDLSDNHLSGKLPTEGFQDMWSLGHLDVSRNALTGSVPGNFHDFCLERMFHLDVSSNFITALPDSLRKLKWLS
jgi:hypothetical protein